MNRTRIAVLFGGRSGEHEVSLVSAASVMQALRKDRYEILPVGIGKTGEWLYGPHTLSWLKGESESQPETCILPPDPSFGGILVRSDQDWRCEKVDVVFPVLHGTHGEDGTIQGLLEMAGLPYVGAGVLGSSLAMDKVMQKQVHRAAGIPVTDFLAFPSQRIAEDLAAIIAECEEVLGYPVFVKPPNLGSSVGISKATTSRDLDTALALAARYDRKVIVEKAVPSAREIEVAILGNQDPVASIPGEIVACNDFYDYDAKYVDGASQVIIPAELEDTVRDQIRDLAIHAYRSLDCEGLARVDFLINRETGEIFVNEINTMPGFTSISMYPKLFAHGGMEYEDLLDRLVDLALDRHRVVAGLERSYRPRTAWYTGADHE